MCSTGPAQYAQALCMLRGFNTSSSRGLLLSNMGAESVPFSLHWRNNRSIQVRLTALGGPPLIDWQQSGQSNAGGPVSWSRDCGWARLLKESFVSSRHSSELAWQNHLP